MKTFTNAKELRELNACESGYDVFVRAHGEDNAKLSQCLKSNGWQNVWWFIGATYKQFSSEQKYDLRVYACQRALVNIEKIKPYCSDVDYGVIAHYLTNPTEDGREAAKSAAMEAWSAARSAVMSSVTLGATFAAKSASMAAAESTSWATMTSANAAAEASHISAVAEAMEAAESIMRGRPIGSGEEALSLAEEAINSANKSGEDAKSAAGKQNRDDLMQLFLKWENQ